MNGILKKSITSSSISFSICSCSLLLINPFLFLKSSLLCWSDWLSFCVSDSSVFRRCISSMNFCTSPRSLCLSDKSICFSSSKAYICCFCIRNTPRTSAVPPCPVWKNPDIFWYLPHLPGLFPVLWIIWKRNLINRHILRIMLYQLTWQHIIISISEINPVGRLLIQFIRIPVNLWLCNQKVINSLDGAAINLISINQLLNPIFQLYTLSVLNKTPCS